MTHDMAESLMGFSTPDGVMQGYEKRLGFDESSELPPMDGEVLLRGVAQAVQEASRS